MDDLLLFIEEEGLTNKFNTKTKFELDNITLGGLDGVTPWLKLKKCIQKIQKRSAILEKLDVNLKYSKIEVKILTDKLAKGDLSELEVKETNFEIDLENIDIKSTQFEIDNIVEEFKILKDIYNDLKNDVKTLREKYSDEELEKDSYVNMFMEEINNQLLANQLGTSIKFTSTLLCMADKTVVDFVMSNAKQMVCESIVDNYNLQEVAQQYVMNAKKANATTNVDGHLNEQPETEVVNLQDLTPEGKQD